MFTLAAATEATENPLDIVGGKSFNIDVKWEGVKNIPGYIFLIYYFVHGDTVLPQDAPVYINKSVVRHEHISGVVRVILIIGILIDGVGVGSGLIHLMVHQVVI